MAFTRMTRPTIFVVSLTRRAKFARRKNRHSYRPKLYTRALWRTIGGTGCQPCLLITDDVLLSCQGADPLNDLASVPTSNSNHLRSEL